jgi:hypothetical protein
MSPQEALGIFLILLGCAGPIIIVGVIYYLKKRLEHKQIMAAIEKGTPLSELWPAKQNGTLWIRNLTVGIALFVIGVGCLMGPMGNDEKTMFIAAILIGVGIAWIVRGLLNRKYQAKTQLPAREIPSQGKNLDGISAS